MVGLAFTRAGALAGFLLALVCFLVVPVSARAQEFGLPDSSIIVIDANRLFSESAFGNRVKSDLEAESAALAAENRRIEAELAAEEKALTEERADMDADVFREKADAFDAKVQRIRSEQEAKAVALAGESDTAQRRFLAAARPVLEELMSDSGALVLLDSRSVILNAGAVDMTSEAVRRIDLAIGDGAGLVPREPGPQSPSSGQD